MAKSCLVFFGVVALTLGVVYGASDDEIAAVRAAVKPLVEGCAKEHGITTEMVTAAKKAGNIDLLDSCFYACFFKKVGFIDANGHFDSATAIEKNKKYFKNEDDVKKIERIAQTCLSVNDATVSDGDKACERAKLLLACFLKEKAEFTLFQFQ